MMLEFGQERSEVRAGELPLEGPCHPLVVVVESKQAIPQLRQRRKVIRREHLALYDREVDLDLVEPAGMTGVWTGTIVGQRRRSRSSAFLPRWDEPLSVIQN